MVRPRFHKLTSTQQQRILDAALQEFAGNGFGDASLNRIIGAAGISKGSMYYYFDSKEDLYAHVIRDQLEHMLDLAGPFPVPETGNPGEFWSALTDDYLRLMRALAESPSTAALLRDWLGGTGSPALRTAQDDAEREVLPWVTQTLTAGQRIGAVRTDLPPELLIAVVMALGQAIDVWLIGRSPADTDLEDAVRTLIGVLRRAIGP